MEEEREDRESGQEKSVRRDDAGDVYQLLYNRAAGDHTVRVWSEDDLDDWQNSGYRTQDGFYNEVGLYSSEDELNKAIEKLKGKSVFAVFINRGTGECWWSKEDNLSGNWRGSRERFANCVLECETQELAQAFVDKYYKNQ